jgi:hypothetical protein
MILSSEEKEYKCEECENLSVHNMSFSNTKTRNILE